MASVKMLRLTEKQLDIKLNFINNYINSSNAATGSVFDANSNVTNKNVGTLMSELNKDINIQIKRKLVCNELDEIFGTELSELYIQQLEEHLIYANDETATVLPYCVAISMYPFFESGLQSFGGESKAPKHLSSYCGGFINLVFALSSQFAGAVACVEFLLGFDHYARLDYGDDYLNTHLEIVTQEMQQVIYAINQPASARGMQSCFLNISIFDKYYFNSLFGNFMFPNGDKPKWESLDRLQRFFLRWFNQERTKALLTFPVVTVAMLHDGENLKDQDLGDFIANEVSEGNAFFLFFGDKVEALSSCCRLKSDISDQLNDFQYSLGAGGVMTGSINVLTLNVSRFVQDCFKSLGLTKYSENDLELILEHLRHQIRLMHKFQLGFRSLFDKLIVKNLMPAYTAKFIDIDKQYCTVGLNGVLESAEFLGYEPTNNDEYKNYVGKLFKVISDENKKAKKIYGIKFNTEQIPAESVGVKFANWDKKDKYFVPRDCYNSYLYRVEDEDISIIDKFELHGKKIMQYMDGGSALHANLETYPTKETIKKLFKIAIRTGCPYFCFNIKVTICNQCGFINKQTKNYCIRCGSKDIDYATRIIGYLKRISSFSVDRQIEASKRYYHTSCYPTNENKN